jgi:hypothetical protein
MAKRIEFIAPVEYVRGNLSGKQDLVYPSSNNRAFEAPQGKVNYARNYRPSYIGAKRSSDGLNFFSVRTKNAVNITSSSKRTMAVNGASFGLTSKILADEVTATALNTQMRAAIQAGQFSGNLRQFVYFYFHQMISNYAASIRIDFLGGLVNILYNPWMSDQEVDYAPTKDVLVKFWTSLHTGGITFKVNNLTGIAEEGYTFDDVYGNANVNVLGLTIQEIGEKTYIKMGDLYLLNPAGNHVELEDAVIADGKYKTTTVAPTA